MKKKHDNQPRGGTSLHPLWSYDCVREWSRVRTDAGVKAQGTEANAVIR